MLSSLDVQMSDTASKSPAFPTQAGLYILCSLTFLLFRCLRQQSVGIAQLSHTQSHREVWLCIASLASLQLPALRLFMHW